MKSLILLLPFLLIACTSVDHTMNEMDMGVDSEASFVVNMIPHHQEAVDTSYIIAQSTQNPALKDLAERIIIAQESEITMMQGWVATWYEDAAPAHYMNMMPALEQLEGTARDTAYLEGMIAHHEMAVHMAENVLDLNPRSEVKEFAQGVIAVQTQEIAEMRELLQTP